MDAETAKLQKDIKNIYAGNTKYSKLDWNGKMLDKNGNPTDVLHAFYIVEIGVKQDVVPGVETLAWVDTNDVEPGKYNIYCTEFCGDNHSKMLATLWITEVE